MLDKWMNKRRLRSASGGTHDQICMEVRVLRISSNFVHSFRCTRLVSPDRPTFTPRQSCNHVTKNARQKEPTKPYLRMYQWDGLWMLSTIWHRRNWGANNMWELTPDSTCVPNSWFKCARSRGFFIRRRPPFQTGRSATPTWIGD